MTTARAGTLSPVTLTDPKTFLVLALHATACDATCQSPRITKREALDELARDVRAAELRNLMEAV